MGLKKNFFVFGIFFLAFGVFFSSSFVSAADILDELHLNIQTTDGSGNVVTGTYDFVFNISTTQDCNNVIYSNSTSLTTDSRGIVSYYLPNVDLGYADQYYLCYYRDGSLIDSAKVSRAPYSFRSKYVNISGVEVDSNLDLGNYNLSANYIFGDGSGLTNLNVSEIDLGDYFTSSEILGFGYYNSTNFLISDYYTKTESDSINLSMKNYVDSNFYLSSNPSGFINWAQVVNGTLALNSSLVNYYPLSNPYGYVNSTTASGVYVPYTGSNSNVVLGDYNFSVGTSDFFVDASTGNVGIGTSSPASELSFGATDATISTDTSDGSDNKRIIVSSSGGASTSRGAYLNLRGNEYSSSAGVVEILAGNVVTGDIKFYTQATERMSIDYGGNVGIGTNNPGYKLHVESSTGANDILRAGNSFISVDSAGSASAPSLVFNGDTDTGIYRNTSNVLGISTAGLERLRIDGSGNVGIGTTSPSQELEVSGNVNVTQNITISGMTIYKNTNGDIVFRA